MIPISTVERAVAVMSKVLDGIEHAHELGVQHRDLKPANIMLLDSGWAGDLRQLRTKPGLSASNPLISRVTSPIDSHYGVLHGAAL